MALRKQTGPRPHLSLKELRGPKQAHREKQERAMVPADAWGRSWGQAAAWAAEPEGAGREDSGTWGGRGEHENAHSPIN